MNRDNINKLAAEFIVTAEDSLNRTLTPLEKVAILGLIARGLGRFGQGVYTKAIKPLLSPGSQQSMSNLKTEIMDAWHRYGPSGLNQPFQQRVVSTFKAGVNENPGVMMGASISTGLGAGYITNKFMTSQQSNQQIPRPVPIYASIINIDKEIEKLGEDKNKESNKDKWLYAGAGALGGLLLGIRNKRILNRIRTKELEEGTKNIRELGSILGEKYKEFSKKNEQEFNEMFKGITDIKKQTIIKNTTKDIEKLINEVGRNIPNSERNNIHDLNRKLNNLIDKAHAEGELTRDAAEYLRKSVNNKFKVQNNDLNKIDKTNIENLIHKSLGITPNQYDKFMVRNIIP